jgi:hypothetical protein
MQGGLAHGSTVAACIPSLQALQEISQRHNNLGEGSLLEGIQHV